MKLGILGDLRREVLQKCSLKLNMGLPNVQLHKLTVIESNGSSGHPLTSSAPDKSLSEGGDEQDLDDDKSKHSSSEDDHGTLPDGDMVDRGKDSTPDDNDMDNCIVLSDEDVNDPENDDDNDLSKAWDEPDLLDDNDNDNFVGLSEDDMDYPEDDGDNDNDQFKEGEEQDLDDKSEQRPSEDNYDSLSDGDMVDRSEDDDDDDYTPDTFGSSTCQTGSKRTNINQKQRTAETDVCPLPMKGKGNNNKFSDGDNLSAQECVPEKEDIDRCDDAQGATPNNQLFGEMEGKTVAQQSIPSTTTTSGEELQTHGPANQSGNQMAEIDRDGKYSTPIIICGSNRKSGKHAEKSFKKWILIPVTGKYKCSLCPKESSIGGSLCPKQYSYAGINLHFKSAHLKIRYKCPDEKCGRLFYSRLGYKGHADTVHLGIRIECPHCKKKIRPGMLQWHEKGNAETGKCPLLRME